MPVTNGGAWPQVEPEPDGPRGRPPPRHPAKVTWPTTRTGTDRNVGPAGGRPMPVTNGGAWRQVEPEPDGLRGLPPPPPPGGGSPGPQPEPEPTGTWGPRGEIGRASCREGAE